MPAPQKRLWKARSHEATIGGKNLPVTRRQKGPGLSATRKLPTGERLEKCARPAILGRDLELIQPGFLPPSPWEEFGPSPPTDEGPQELPRIHRLADSFRGWRPMPG
jgi:hypothetical protein